MQVVSELPPELANELQGMTLANEAMLLAGQYEEARKGFEAMYNLRFEHQPRNQRYHKGYELHQIGMTFVLSGQAGKAMLYFLLAYVEDLLSKAIGHEDEADLMPAARNLREVYKVDESALSQLKNIIREKKLLDIVVGDPNNILMELRSGRSVAEITKPEQIPQIGVVEKRRLGLFESDWEKRVFVGGSYSTHLSELNQIKKTCIEKGYDAVIALEFNIPKGKAHHHALMLLHECSKAIFEVSYQAGQLMEIERLRDYGIKPLIVCQEGAYLTAMLEELVLSQDYEVKHYSDPQQLETLVIAFLSAKTD
jgi:hypothetical protein